MTIKCIGKICKQSENVYEIVRYLFAFLFVLRCEYICWKINICTEAYELSEVGNKARKYHLLDFILLPIINYV